LHNCATAYFSRLNTPEQLKSAITSAPVQCPFCKSFSDSCNITDSEEDKDELDEDKFELKKH
jgi:hypothetical protein